MKMHFKPEKNFLFFSEEEKLCKVSSAGDSFKNNLKLYENSL